MIVMLIRIAVFALSCYLYFRLTNYLFKEFEEDSHLLFYKQMHFEAYVKKWYIVWFVIGLLSICSTILVLTYFNIIFLLLLLAVLFIVLSINKEEQEYTSKQREVTNIVEEIVDEVVAKLRIKEFMKVMMLENSRTNKEFVFFLKVESGAFFDEISKERFIYSIQKKLRSESIKPNWLTNDGYSKFKFIIEDSDLDEIQIVIAICLNEETYSAFERYSQSQMTIQKPINIEDEDF